MDLEIQPAKLLNFDQGSRSWIEIPAGDSIDESPPSSPQTLHSLVIATWNIWEDDRFTDYRHPYILRELFEKEQGEEGENAHGRPYFDVITLQEVTPEFFAVLLAHPTVQTEWLVTDLAHQLNICPNPYGTVILIRESVLVRGRYSVAAGFHEFENTRMQRGLNFVELSSRFTSGDCIGASRRPIMRIGTAHFESHPEDKRKRREQFQVSADILTSSESSFPRGNDQSDSRSITPNEFVPAVLTGDCNICSYDELNPLLNPENPESDNTPAFIDAFLAAARPIELSDRDSEEPLDPFTSHPTFGVTYPNRRLFGFGSSSSSGSAKPPQRSARAVPRTRRLDYIFAHGLRVSHSRLQSKEADDYNSSERLRLEAGLFGNDPVCEMSEAGDEEGRDGRVYASDHLGVWVRVHSTFADSSSDSCVSAE